MTAALPNSQRPAQRLARSSSIVADDGPVLQTIRFSRNICLFPAGLVNFYHPTCLFHAGEFLVTVHSVQRVHGQFCKTTNGASAGRGGFWVAVIGQSNVGMICLSYGVVCRLQDTWRCRRRRGGFGFRRATRCSNTSLRRHQTPGRAERCSASRSLSRTAAYSGFLVRRRFAADCCSHRMAGGLRPAPAAPTVSCRRCISPGFGGRRWRWQLPPELWTGPQNVVINSVSP